MFGLSSKFRDNAMFGLSSKFRDNAMFLLSLTCYFRTILGGFLAETNKLLFVENSKFKPSYI
jgi:hypothetical protein